MAVRKKVIAVDQPTPKFIAVYQIGYDDAGYGYAGFGNTAKVAYNRLMRRNNLKPEDVVMFEITKLGKAKVTIEWETD